MTNIDLILDITMLSFLVITAIGVVVIRNMLTSTILLSIFSLLMSAEYLILGAPDVAITEAAVGAGISTLLMLMALTLTGDKEKKPKGNQIIPLIIVSATAGTLFYAISFMPVYGDSSAPAHKHLSPYFINQSYGDIEIPNFVTSVLASYRGFDTLGETTVVFAAGLAVVMLIGTFKKIKFNPKSD